MRIAVSLKNTPVTATVGMVQFQSAVRIAVSLKDAPRQRVVALASVSIRRADRCLAEVEDAVAAFLAHRSFNPPCGSLSR